MQKGLPTIPGSGPGPSTLIKYDADTDTGYFGSLGSTAFFSYSDVIAAAKTPLPGVAANQTAANYWMKLYSKGKVLYMPRNIIRTGTTWADIYRAGMVYGIDGPGIYNPATGPVNQLTKMVLTSADQTKFVFIVRMISGYADNPAPTTGLLQPRIVASEYTQLRERLSSNNAPAGWTWYPTGVIGSIGGLTLAMETVGPTPTQGILLNNNANYLMRTIWDITTNQFCNFYPVLELVEIIAP
jgi:hypothetical protein